jgi:hypothetical protein
VVGECEASAEHDPSTAWGRGAMGAPGEPATCAVPATVQSGDPWAGAKSGASPPPFGRRLKTGGGGGGWLTTLRRAKFSS